MEQVLIRNVRLGLAALAVATVQLATVPAADAAKSGSFTLPEIFLLGDSQFAFGAGPAFHDFFENFTENCSKHTDDKELLAYVDMRRVGLMGVRSTSIHSWVAHKWRRKKFVCEPDPKWRVNARLYGWDGHRNGSYVQLGHDPDFQICHPRQSVFEAMFADKMQHPKLALFFFMGNAVTRWARSKKNTAKDIRKLHEQLPKSTACIVMTTVPSYRKKDNKIRSKAQAGLMRALQAANSRCTFLPGYTKRTLATYQGNAKYYRRHKSGKKAGKVKDPYHPSPVGARKFIELKRPALCKAVLKELTPAAVAYRESQKQTTHLSRPLRDSNVETK